MNLERCAVSLTTSAPAAAPARAGSVTLAISCAAPLLVLIDYTVPMVTLPETATALGAGATGPAWILNGISLGLAALLLVAGGIADDYGRRRTFVIGMAVLAISTAAGAVAPNATVFVLARLVQGGASAALLAASLGAIGHAYPTGHERLRASGLYGSMLSLGVAAGPLISAGVAAVAGWRAIYWAIALAAAALTLLAARLLPESRAERPRRLDGPGVVTLSLGLAALVAGITEGRQGWARPIVPIAFGAAAVLIAAFVVIENRRRDPLLDLGLLRRPLFLVSTGGALIAGFGIVGLMSYLPTTLQLAHGLTPVDTALLFGAWSGVSFLTALLARRLRVTARTRLVAGLLLSAAGYLPLLGLAGQWSPARVVAGLVIAGVGYGLVNASLTHLSIESVPHSRVSMGSGANNTARYVGSSLGVAVTAVLVGGEGLRHGIDVALIAFTVLIVLTALATLAVRREPAQG
jgi:MFS family permease